eukprot:3748665-Pleurochrysis_carterae.AAC.2
MITVRDVSVGHLAMALPPLPRNHPPCPLCFLPSWWWEGKTSVARAKNSSAVPAVSTATLLPPFASLNLSPRPSICPHLLTKRKGRPCRHASLRRESTSFVASAQLSPRTNFCQRLTFPEAKVAGQIELDRHTASFGSSPG